MALKAASINNPPSGLEGQLYAEISRSKPAPQGICVANSAGKVLAWTLSFDNDAAISKFLDYAVSRYQESPTAERPVTAERFMRFPGNKLPDVADTGRTLTIPESHLTDDRCPGIPQVERGTLVGRIIGRPLNEQGQPIRNARFCKAGSLTTQCCLNIGWLICVKLSNTCARPVPPTSRTRLRTRSGKWSSSSSSVVGTMEMNQRNEF